MRGYSRRLAAVVFAVTAGSVAWGLTISYTDPTGNDQGAAYTGGKTIRLNYTGASSAPDPSHVWFHTSRVSTDLGCSVVVTGAATGTIDIEVPPKQGGWPSVIGIGVDPNGPPPSPTASNLLGFTYWGRPVLAVSSGELPGQMQQRWAGDWITIYGSNFPDPVTPGGTTLLHGRTITVEFGSGNPSSEVQVYTGLTSYIRVKVPDTSPVPGQIGPSTQVALTVTVDDGDLWDEMTAADTPRFTWCPSGPTLASVNPVGGPLAGNSASNYVTLSGTNFYGTLDGGLGYTYVSFDGDDGPWLTPDEVADASGNTVLTCPLPPQPDKLEIEAEVYVKNAYTDLGGHVQLIDQKGPHVFYYKDQPPFPVLVRGGLDGATLAGDILLQAKAVDDRAITRVEFRYWQGAGPPTPTADNWDQYSLLPSGTDTTWPYECVWNTDSGVFPDASGPYHIIVVAYDDHAWTSVVDSSNYAPEIYTTDGKNIVASSAVTVDLSNDDPSAADNPPQAQMLVPSDGAVLSVDGGVITLSALVADYEGLLDAANTVEFVVVDADGGKWSSSLPLSWLTFLYRDDTDPANPLDWYLATVTWNGQIGGEPAADGPHEITVEVWDTLSQSATDGVAVTVDGSAVCITSITPDGSEPLFGSDLAGADADPTSGTYHQPLVVTIRGDGFVDGATTVAFAGVAASDVTWVSATELTVVVPNLGLPPSASGQAIDISVTTADGSQTHSGMFYVEDSDPYVEFLGPQDGATVGGLVLLQVDARDDSAIASVTYQYSPDDATWFDIATVDATTDNYPFSYEYDTTALGAGTFYFRALATDDGGNVLPEPEATSVALNLDQSTYDNPPRVTITSPAQGAAVSGDSVVLQATVTDAEAASITSIITALPRFEIVSAGRNETLGTITLDPVIDPTCVTSVTMGTWILSATWDTTEVDGSGNAVYPDGSFYLVRAAATDDADDVAAPLGEYNTGYDAVSVTVRNAAPVKPPRPPVVPIGGGGGGGCAPGDNAAPAAAFLLLGTVFLVFRRRRRAPA